MDIAIIEREALSLSAVERALLADRLLLTLDLVDGEKMERLGREADRRLESFERGETPAAGGAETIAAIRRELGSWPG